MATTALRAYRYPLSTDDVRPYEDIKNVADDIDTDVGALYAAAWVAFSSPTLTWSGSTGAPTLGNASLTGRYQLLTTKMIRYQVRLVYGSTSAPGTGFWIFNLPFNASADAILFCKGVSFIDDISAQGRPGTSRLFSATQLIMDNSAGAVTGLSPATAATNDVYTLDITYDRV